MTCAGYADDGAPGPRLQYGPTYYGAFVLDPEGNSVEAVHRRPSRDDGTVIDHLWLRVADLAVSTRFYAAVAPAVGHRAERLGDRTMIRGDGASFSVVEGTPSANVQLAFGAPDRESVDWFHEAGLTEGLQSARRPESGRAPPGLLGAYLAEARRQRDRGQGGLPRPLAGRSAGAYTGSLCAGTTSPRSAAR